MGIRYCKSSRRQFLVGSGKSLLMLPILPSLLPREALAQSAVAPKRMMLFWFDHNNLSNLWPQRSAATTAIGSSGMRETLLRNMGAATSISPTFSNALYDSLKTRDLITILRGFDTAVAYGPGHGNFTLASGMDRNSEGNYPTMDTIIEASRAVYPNSTSINVRKALRVNFNDLTIFYQKVGNSIQALPDYQGSEIQTFYNDVFAALTCGTVQPVDQTNQLKSNILNRVHESFTSFKNNRRISADDRARLDQHMGFLSDLQRSYASIVPPPAQGDYCVKPSAPGNVGGDPSVYVGVYMDLLAAAFKNNLSKFGTMYFEAHDPRWMPGLNINGNVMHEAMHGDFGATYQINSYQNWWRYNMNLIASRFLTHLDTEEGSTGRTYLDNMVTGMVCAGGIHNTGNDGGHAGLDSQQILIGSMGGAMRAGRYMSMPSSGGLNLPYNCFLLTLLNLMGVPSSEYASATADGNGFGYYSGFGNNHPYRNRFYSPITEILT